MTPETRDAETNRLAALAREGDSDAFETLCRLLRDDVWRYCAALLGDREQAFDAAQDTFLRLVKAIGRWRGDAPIRVFVLVLARRAVADLIRTEQRRRRMDEVSRAQPAPTVPGTGTIEVVALVNDLDPAQRQAFVLTQVLGLTYDESAEVAGVAVGTIRSRVSRARGHLVAAIHAAQEG
ncbi:MAG: RNA polymerase sigma factor [Euzebya sp.]